MTKKCHQLQLKAIVIALLALILISAPVAAADQPDHTKTKATSTVIEVYDGDTIKLANGMEVRYLGLDTPETHHPEKPIEYFGFKTSEFNKGLVGGEKVKLEYDANKNNQYGRLLAYVYVKQDGEWINVNAKLLEEGYARFYTLPPNVKYSDYLLQLEREARENCRGLCPPTVKDLRSFPRRKSRRKWGSTWAMWLL